MFMFMAIVLLPSLVEEVGQPFVSYKATLGKDPGKGQSGSEPGAFNGPTYVSELPDGNLLVSEAQNDRLQVVTPRGGHERFLPSKVSNPGGSAVSGGHIFVAQQQGRGLQKLTLDGALVSHAGGDFGRKAEWIESALGVLARASTVFVADVTQYRVNAYDEATLALRFAIDRHSLPAHPAGCTDRSGGNRYLGPSCFNPHGLAHSRAHGGRLFVSDPDNNVIQVCARGAAGSR